MSTLLWKKNLHKNNQDEVKDTTFSTVACSLAHNLEQIINIAGDNLTNFADAFPFVAIFSVPFRG